MGGDMTYTCLGNNQYLIQLTVYRDCNSVTTYENNLPLSIFSHSCDYQSSTSIILTDNYPLVITPICELEEDLCDSENGTYGVQEFLYERVVTLPEDCSEILVSFSDCCRNAAISTLVSPNQEEFYIGAVVNTQDVLCNSSPKFNNNPTPFSCVGQEVNYNHGVTDADGDDLVFSLVDCYQSYDTGVLYQSPYSGTNPLQAINLSIDPVTGAISFIPTALQVGILCVKVEEYRNGVKIGEIIRDIQFTVLNCSTNTIDENILPVISGIDGTASQSGTTGEFEASLCYGTNICFALYAFDADGHRLELSWNESIEDASFIVSNNNSQAAEAEFCWTPDIDDVGVNFFTVTVKDDACDIRGINTYTFKLLVTDGGLDYNYTESQVSCFGGSDGSATITFNPPLTNPTITWPTSPPQTGFTATNLSAGTYYVMVQDVSVECDNASIKIDISENEAIDVVADGITNQISCAGENDADLDVHITGGIGPYSVIWSNNETDTILNNLVAGNYTISITDAEGCLANQTFTVTEPPVLSVDYVRSDYNNYGISCTGGNDGWIDLTVQGGTPLYNTTWSNGATTEDLNNLLAGNYGVTVTDDNGCQDSLMVVLDEPTPLVSTLDNISATCFESKDGSIVIENVVGAVPPYAWSLNGESFVEIDTFPVIIPNQRRGEKTIYFRDDVGCIYTNTTFIESPDPLFVTIIPTDTLLSLGDDLQVSFLTNSTDLYDVNWTSTLEGFDCDTCLFFDYQPLATTNFSLELVEQTNGCRADAKAAIRVAEESYIFMPNVFSPNDDGFNDLLNVFAKSTTVTAINYLRIYDRWGATVYEEVDFQPNDVQLGWDGYVNGKKAPAGVYVYVLEAQYINGKNKLISGDITLIR